MKKIVLSLIVATVGLMAADGAELYKKCASCHGQKAEKAALNKSEIIAGWDAAKSTEALAAYKAGTRNIHGMGGLMKGQVAAYSDADIAAVSAYIATLK
jgi:cytochrome c553